MTDAKATIYYTLEEIAKNNGKDTDRVWIIYKDIVYDVTDYLNDHPGGGELITEWAGKDCTKAFDDFGHSGDAKRDLKALKIGEVVEEERKKKQKKTEKEATKGPKVVESKEKVINRSCIHIITCGLCA
ncbi:cytochrome b5 [Anoplophora glabripennis]|uniref:Cytochrome b5 n=1 Tax=Anoplophora glabripennis TaxID=217634 RepID=V5IAH5_ANOGL|nr:cytochrome b5 [Anoplophora glabripennis]